MLGRSRFVFAFPLALLVAACSGSSSSSGGGAPSGDDPSDSPTPPGTSTSDAGGAVDASTPPPSEHDAAPTPKAVKLQLQSAAYRNTTAAGGGFVYAVSFSLANGSSSAVVSLSKMSFDFGGGNVVSLTEPACDGTFAIEPGGSRVVDTQVVVSAAGKVTNFAMICGSSQLFGGATGKAPGVSTFAGPIAIAASGTTSDGTFTAEGTASRSN